MPEIAVIAPNVTSTLQMASCDTSPCFICWLREKVNDAPETKSVAFSEVPLQLNLLGIRKETSLSDQFDDKMVVFFKVLGAEHQQGFEKAVEKELRDSLESAMGKVPGLVKFIPCSKGLWVASLFRISTDPGLVERRGELEAKQKNLQKQVDAERAKLEALEKEEKAVAERIPRAQEELKGSNDEGTIKKLKKEISKLQSRTKSIPKDRLSLEKKLKALEEQSSQIAQRIQAHDESPGEFEIDEGNEGWYEEGRAIIPPGHYADHYTFFIHKISSTNVFAKDTSLAALTVGFLKGMRIYSVEHVRQNAKDFEGHVVRQIKKARGDELRFSDDSVTLEMKKSGQGAMEAFYKQGGTSTKLAADDKVLIRREIGGTNIHRAHNAQLLPDGTLSGSGSAAGRVAEWSAGCQVFPLFDEFNVFLRLCAISKRWRCASASPQAAAGACTRMTVGTAAVRGLGEEALIGRFKEGFVNEAADLHKSYSARAKVVKPQIKRLEERKSATEWTDAEEKSLAELLKTKAEVEKAKGKVDAATLKKIKTLEGKKAKCWTEKDEAELRKLQQERDEWRREYLREKVLRLRADFMQSCDVSGACKQRFTYTLLQCSASEMEDLHGAWTQARNKAWDKKLVVGVAK